MVWYYHFNEIGKNKMKLDKNIDQKNQKKDKLSFYAHYFPDIDNNRCSLSNVCSKVQFANFLNFVDEFCK